MFTASQIKKTNVAEYLLYMWQIEDLIRAYDFDIDKIDENIISRYTSLSDDQRSQLRGWYESLIDMMLREGVKSSGHIQLNKSVVSDMRALHDRLLKDPRFADYSAEFYRTLPFIVELRAKAGENKAGEIESCFNALYGVMLLRLQKKEISSETQQAIAQISRFIATLNNLYMKDLRNELFTEDEI
jgi:flagellin-specific chaperone FliS